MLCIKPKSKTQIIYGVNLNFKIVDYYLDLLTQSVLLEKIDDKYRSTERGRAVAESLKMVNKEFD